MVEKVPLGQPVTPEAVELYADLQMRYYVSDLRHAEWQRILREQGRGG